MQFYNFNENIRLEPNLRSAQKLQNDSKKQFFHQISSAVGTMWKMYTEEFKYIELFKIFLLITPGVVDFRAPCHRSRLRNSSLNTK